MTLRFDFAFSGASADGQETTAADATRGRLVVRVEGRLVWDLEWTWIELLEHLGTHWKYLTWEEAAPEPFNAFSPETLETHAREYFGNTRPEKEEAEFDAFLESHDLARAVRGAWPRRLWLMRCGRQFLVWTPIIESMLDGSAVLGSLEAAGEQIVAQLERVQSDERAVRAIERWRARSTLPAIERITLASGLPEEVLRETAAGEDAVAFWTGPSGSSGELVALARMSGTLMAPSVLRGVLDRVRAAPVRPTIALDALSAAIGVSKLEDKPYLDGYRVANQVRRLLVIEGRFDVEGQLAAWGVEIAEHEMPEGVDAVCVWGAEHGPLIVVNPKGRHAASASGRRATLAHEVGHLLMDRGHALPLGEVFGGRLPKRIEQRARAFAAELLLPRATARAVVEASESLEAAMDILQRDFGASRELIAWQIRNSDLLLSETDAFYLKTQTAPRY